MLCEVFLYRVATARAIANVQRRWRRASELSHTLLKMLMAHLAFGDLFVLTFLLHVWAALDKQKKKKKPKKKNRKNEDEVCILRSGTGCIRIYNAYALKVSNLERFRGPRTDSPRSSEYPKKYEQTHLVYGILFPRTIVAYEDGTVSFTARDGHGRGFSGYNQSNRYYTAL